jgi:hypothetical protein
MDAKSAAYFSAFSAAAVARMTSAAAATAAFV